jgi:hypothetical protein
MALELFFVFARTNKRHHHKPANGSPGRELQLSTSCNPRILQGRGMFDGASFFLGEGFSRGGVLFLIIFKLLYKRTPLTGKPRHERPALNEYVRTSFAKTFWVSFEPVFEKRLTSSNRFRGWVGFLL